MAQNRIKEKCWLCHILSCCHHCSESLSCLYSFYCMAVSRRGISLEEAQDFFYCIFTQGDFLVIFYVLYSTLRHLAPLLVSEDAGIELRTVATLALAVTRSNHSARSYPLLSFWLLFPLPSKRLPQPVSYLQRKFIDWKKTKLFHFRWNWAEEKKLRGIIGRFPSSPPTPYTWPTTVTASLHVTGW